MTTLDPRVRAILVCPICRGELDLEPAGLVCRSDQLLFPVVDGVPWMIPERAKPWPVCERNGFHSE